MNKMNLGNKTRQFLELLAEINPPPPYSVSPVEARNNLLGLQEKYYKPENCEIQEFKVDLKGVPSFNLYFYRPKNKKEKLPVVLYVHGGGWFLGGKEVFDMYIRKLCNKINMAVAFVDYSLSPEVKYPVAINQVYGALKYIKNNVGDLNVDAGKIAIAGDSAGGNMATVTAIRASKENGPKVRAQVLIYPVTDLEMNYKSYEEFENGPWLTKKSMEEFKKAYLPDDYKENDTYHSPIKASLEELASLPPTLVIVDENDPLRDEGEQYAQKLDDAGVETLSLRINGTFHDYMMLNALSDTPQAKETLKIVASFLKEHLT